MKHILIAICTLFVMGGCQSNSDGAVIDNRTVKTLVLNAGYKDGKYKEIKGKAKQPNPADPGKLKVSFFLWFYSDYYVLILDPNYRYVVIGSSSDKYLWIMSRNPDLAEDVIRDLLDQLRERGYDTAKLVYSYRQ